MAAEAPATVPEIRKAFEKQKDIEYSISTISGKDLEITKENDRLVIRFAYDKEIELVEPVYPADQVRGSLQVGRNRAHRRWTDPLSTRCSNASATALRSPALLARALTHRSFGTDHNERLEFLGDAVLSLAVSACCSSASPVPTKAT